MANWTHSLPGSSLNTLSPKSIIVEKAFEIKDNNQLPIMTISTDGMMTGSSNNSVEINELVEITTLLKRVMLDISLDPELSKRFPYVKDATQEWLMKELRK